MTTSNTLPPRKLTEFEDIASFDDWWSQIECYYSKDEDFCEFFTNPDFTWQSKTAPYRGLESEQKAANLNNLLRAIAMFTVGPYIRTNITDKATSLAEVKEEFLKFLEIESSGAIGAVSPLNRSSNDSPYQDQATLAPAVAPQEAYQSGYRGVPQDKAGYREKRFQPRKEFQPSKKCSGPGNQSSSSTCEYCYIQSKTRNIDFNHPIAQCPEMPAMHGPADMLNDAGDFEEFHEFETFAQEFIEQERNSFKEKATLSELQELPPVNMTNITGIGSNDKSIGTIPQTSVLKLPAKPIQPPPRPTPSDKSQLSLSQEFVERSQQTSPGNFIHDSMLTIAILSADLSVQTWSNNEEPVTDPDNSEVGGVVALQAQVEQLKKEVAKLMFENNRYHFAISNCTLCASDDVTSDASIFLTASIRASTPVSSKLPSSGQAPALLSRTIPALMSLKIDDRIKAEVDTMQKKKDKVFISRMVETLTKLEIKYLTTRHKKKRLVIDMARTKQIEKTLPAKHAWGSFETDDESNEDETETSIISHFESWNFTNVPNPIVSSDEASTEAKDDQSDLDVVKCVNTSDESNTRTFISLPLDQGSPIYQNLASSPSPPTARSSSTTDLLLDPSCEVVPRMPAAPLLPTLSPTRPSVINCPAGTCDQQSIYSNPLRVCDVSLEPNDDVIDQVPIGNNSPAVTPKNYLILLKFLEAVPSPGDGPVVQQDEETVPVPPPPDIECQDRLVVWQRGQGCLVPPASDQAGGRQGGHPGGDGGQRAQGCARLINSSCFRLSIVA